LLQQGAQQVAGEQVQQVLLGALEAARLPRLLRLLVQPLRPFLPGECCYLSGCRYRGRLLPPHDRQQRPFR
jgi:hypothetical protein